MFKNILIPISSEFFPHQILLRGARLAADFGSDVTIIYILEEKVFQQLEKVSESFRSPYEQTETKSDLAREHKSVADSIVFDEAHRIFSSAGQTFKSKTKLGEFSAVVQQNLQEQTYDLVLMGFKKECLLYYRLLNDATVPVWIESEQHGGHCVLAVCSNISPNQKVPQMSKQLAEALGWDLHVLYVVDVQDTVEVDSNGVRSPPKSEKHLLAVGEQFVENIQRQGISAELIRGCLEREVIRATNRIPVGLVVIGREQKEHKMFGISVRNTKKKLAEKCAYSLLFIN